MSNEPLSNEDFYTPTPSLYTGRASSSPMISREATVVAAAGMLLMLLLTPFILGMLFFMSPTDNPHDTDGPAPEGSYAIRRAWGEEKLKHHFERVDAWVRKSSQIVRDVGSVTGVAPIGGPNSLAVVGIGGDSRASMNLQVIGDKGEGVLCLPKIISDSGRIAGIDNRASWTFENRRYRVFPSGKSWLEKYDFDLLYDQVFIFAEQRDHESVVKTCRTLGALEAEKIGSAPRGKAFPNFPPLYRYKLVRQFANSLAKTSNNSEAANIYVELAAIGLAQVKTRQAYRSRKPNRTQIAKQLANINVTLKKAQALEPNLDSVLKLAIWRSILAYQNKCGTMRFASEKLDSDKRKTFIRRELKDMFQYAEQLAKSSPYLRAELGTITTRPSLGRARLPEEARMFWAGLPFWFPAVIPNYCASEDYCILHLNRDGRYRSYIGIDIEGSNGKTGSLSVLVQERNLDESQQDLFSETPRSPSKSNLTASLIRWEEKSTKKGEKTRSVSLSSKTLQPTTNK